MGVAVVARGNINRYRTAFTFQAHGARSGECNLQSSLMYSRKKNNTKSGTYNKTAKLIR